MTQLQALTIMKTGANVFLTGEPGSGKTYVVNQYVQYLRDHGIEPSVTASTGIASTHIGGMTIHSWSGLGIRSNLTAQDIDNITGKEHTVRRVSRAHVLIIDEVSMLDYNTLDNVDLICREIRRRPEPFGGLQVILVGDFFQLPPINKVSQFRPQRPDISEEVTIDYGDTPDQSSPVNRSDSNFAYNADVWQNMNIVTCYLTEQHRQNDDDLLALLGAIRQQNIADKHHDILLSRVNTEMGDTVTHIYSHNADVDRLNNQRLAKISGQAQSYLMETSGKRALVESLMRGCLSPEILELKQGAVVMFTKNNPILGFVNGTLGTVIDFVSDRSKPVVELRTGEKIQVDPMEWTIEENGKILAQIAQLPLRLAWAITVHKSQGMSMDGASIDLRGAFEFGQGYVALSRVRTLSGLCLYGYNAQSLCVHPEVLEHDSHFSQASVDAVRAFSELGKEKIRDMHKQFLRANGGSLDVIVNDPDDSSSGKTKKSRAKKAPRVPTRDITMGYVREGKQVQWIVQERGLTAGTILGHIEELIQKRVCTAKDIAYLKKTIDRTTLTEVSRAFRSMDSDALGPIFAKLSGKYPYDVLRLVRLFVKD